MWTVWGYEIPCNSHVKITYSWFSTRNPGSTHQLRERWLKSHFLQGFQTPSKRWRTFGISGCHQQYVHLPGKNGILHAIFRRKTSGKNKKVTAQNPSSQFMLLFLNKMKLETRHVDYLPLPTGAKLAKVVGYHHFVSKGKVQKCVEHVSHEKKRGPLLSIESWLFK